MQHDKELSSCGRMALQCVEDSKRWFPDVQTDVAHHTLALCGEVGEFANIVKKIQRGDLDYKVATVRYKLAMELTDSFIYILNLAGLLGVDLERSYEVKRMENEKRFGGVRAEDRSSANGVRPV